MKSTFLIDFFCRKQYIKYIYFIYIFYLREPKQTILETLLLCFTVRVNICLFFLTSQEQLIFAYTSLLFYQSKYLLLLLCFSIIVNICLSSLGHIYIILLDYIYLIYEYNYILRHNYLPLILYFSIKINIRPYEVISSVKL